MPSQDKFGALLAQFAAATGVDEAVIFEANTFLLIAQAVNVPHPDHHRFEKTSNIIKQFRMSNGSEDVSRRERLEICAENYSLVIESVTENMVLMAVASDISIRMAGQWCHLLACVGPAAISHNVAAYRCRFSALLE